MFYDIIVLAFLLLILICSVCGALHRLARCQHLTILDVQKVLRPVQRQRVVQLFDSRVEEVVRKLFSRRKFQDTQLMSLYETREYLLRMSHNAFVFITWANTELWRETKFKPDMEDREVYIDLSRRVYDAAVEFRVYALLTLLRINFWMM